MVTSLSSALSSSLVVAWWNTNPDVFRNSDEFTTEQVKDLESEIQCLFDTFRIVLKTTDILKAS